MAKVMVECAWRVKKLDDITAQMVDRLTRGHGFRRTGEVNSGSDVVLKGGSQVRMRLIGSWFVNPRALPKRASITVESYAGQEEASLRLRLEESQGFGIIDGRVKRRYERTFEATIADLSDYIGVAPTRVDKRDE